MAWRPGFGASVAVVTPSPLVLAVEQGPVGSKADGTEPAVGYVLAIDRLEGTATALHRVNHHAATANGAPMHVGAPGDLTGDGQVDVVVARHPSEVLPAPFDGIGTITLPEIAIGTGFGCDADGDGDTDLCSRPGIDRFPVDGALDTTWEPPGSALGAGVVDGVRIAFVYTVVDQVRSLRLALLSPAGSTGSGEWLVGTRQLDRLAAVDLDGDGSDGLVACVLEQGVGWGLVLVDPFPTERAGGLALPDRCDALEVGDFDGDGAPEVAVGTASHVLIVDPADWTVLADHRGTLRAGQDRFGAALDTADLDGDGRVDLVVGAPVTGRVYFLTDVVP